MYSIINAKNLKLFELSLLDDDPDEDIGLPLVDDLRMEEEDHLEEDIIVKQGVGSMRISELARKGNFLANQSGIDETRQKKNFLIS